MGPPPEGVDLDRWIKIGDFIRNIPFQIILLALFSGIGCLIGMTMVIVGFEGEHVILDSMFITLIPVFIYIIRTTLIRYIFLGNCFFKDSGNILYAYGGKLSLSGIKSIGNILNKIQKSSNSMKEIVASSKTKDLIFFPIIIIFGMIPNIFGNQQIDQLLGTSLLSGYTFPLLAVFFGLYIFTFIFHQLIENFHPLYAFGNLGEKIQKLTPRIEEKSKQIQTEFQSDMNFSVLSNGFDSLSSTFSDIVTLVIKLEKVEKRANKGNIFDSEKYINSLRSDIVTPLNSLKIFLEKQKTELMQSQKELSRVRIGGSESTGNVELQSKRSEPLIQELTENIDKLDMMIGKMG